MSIEGLLCRLFGHRWIRRGEFTGGTFWRCGRCDEARHSFETCPSFQPGIDWYPP